MICIGVSHWDMMRVTQLRTTCLVIQQAGWCVLMTMAEEKEQKGKSVSALSACILSAKTNYRAEPRV